MRDQRQLDEIALLYNGFTVPWNFDLPPRLQAISAAFAERKGWKGKKFKDFINSKKADFLLTLYANSLGIHTFINNEQTTQNPCWDFVLYLGGSIPDIRVESKRMPNIAGRELSFKWEFRGNESCMKWRDYDILLAWCVLDDETPNAMFKPWAVVSSRLLSAEVWDMSWKPNLGGGGGRHLCLNKLPAYLKPEAAFL